MTDSVYSGMFLDEARVSIERGALTENPMMVAVRPGRPVNKKKIVLTCQSRTYL